MWPLYLTFLIILGLVLLPLAVVLLVVNFFAAGLTQLGFSPLAGFLIVSSMIWGSFINIPLGERKQVKVKTKKFFGLFQENKIKQKGLSINMGGAVIPLIIVAYFLPQVPLFEVAIATLLVAIVSYQVSRFVPGLGISMSPILPLLAATLLALVLVPEAPARAAFISGVLGVIVGGDLMRLPEASKESTAVISIGGGGVFDGIFLVGVISAFLAGI